MFAEIGGNPRDTEALEVTVAAHDLERRGGKPQIFEVGIFEGDVGLSDLPLVARNNVTQFIDID
jgi:hypothetical protein